MMFKSICNFIAVCFCKDFDRSVYCFCLANVFLDTFYWHYWWWYACVRGICCMRSGVIRSAWWDDRLRERERERKNADLFDHLIRKASLRQLYGARRSITFAVFFLSSISFIRSDWIYLNGNYSVDSTWRQFCLKLRQFIYDSTATAGEFIRFHGVIRTKLKWNQEKRRHLMYV